MIRKPCKISSKSSRFSSSINQVVRKWKERVKYLSVLLPDHRWERLIISRGNACLPPCRLPYSIFQTMFFTLSSTTAAREFFARYQESVDVCVCWLQKTASGNDMKEREPLWDWNKTGNNFFCRDMHREMMNFLQQMHVKKNKAFRCSYILQPSIILSYKHTLNGFLN